MKTSEILNLAADKIESAGWGQGPDTWDNDLGQGLCLEGGIAAAMQVSPLIGDGFLLCPAYRAVMDHIGPDNAMWHRYGDTDITDARLYKWNDDAGRTAEEVIEVLRACAVIEEAKENAEVMEQVSV